METKQAVWADIFFFFFKYVGLMFRGIKLFRLFLCKSALLRGGLSKIKIAYSYLF